MPRGNVGIVGPDDLRQYVDVMRGLQEEHPVASTVAGFFPPIGMAMDASTLADPQAKGWEKGLAVASSLPLVRMAKLLRRGGKRAPDAMDIDVYHGGPKEIDEFDPKMMGQGEGMLTEGPGAYSSSDPTSAAFYTRMDQGATGQHTTGTVTKFDLPDEDLVHYANLEGSFESQTPEVQKALRKLYPDWEPPKGDIDPYRKWDPSDPIIEHPVRLLGREVQEKGMGGSGLGELEELRQRLMASGLRGTRYTDDLSAVDEVENFATFDPSRLKKLGAEDVDVGKMIKDDPSILHRYPLLGEMVRESEYDEVFGAVKKFEESIP